MTLTHEEMAARLVVVEKAVANLAFIIKELRIEITPPVDMTNDSC